MIAVAMITSVLGAAFNGYGSAHTNVKHIFIGQILWVISNSLWMYLYVFQLNNVEALPGYYQIITFGTFLICAIYGSCTMFKKHYL